MRKQLVRHIGGLAVLLLFPQATRKTIYRVMVSCLFLLAFTMASRRQYPESVPPLQALKHAQALKAEGKWTEAIQELTAVLPRMERLYGENHLNTSHVLNRPGPLLFQRRPVRQGRAPLPTQFEDPRRQARARPPQRRHQPQQPGRSLPAMGQYTRAEPFYQRSLKIREAKLGPDHPEVAQSLTNLALLYRPWASTPGPSLSTNAA